jgi:hypothetical protein
MALQAFAALFVDGDRRCLALIDVVTALTRDRRDGVDAPCVDFGLHGGGYGGVPSLLRFLTRERVANGAVGLRIFPEAPAGLFARVRDGRFLLVTRPTPGRRGGAECRSRELVAARARDLTLADVNPVAWGFPRRLVFDGNIDAATRRAPRFSGGFSRAAGCKNSGDQRAQEKERRKRARGRQRPAIIHTDGAASILREPA